MAYFINLFSPETYKAFSESNRGVSGFRRRNLNAANRIKPGDKLVCYLTRLSRWTGLLEIIDGPFEDATPIFFQESDPFVVRFHVRPLVWLPFEKSVPIFEEAVWKHLSFTRGQTRGASHWTAKVRTSLVPLTDEDGRLLEALMKEQGSGGAIYPVEEADFRKLATHRVKGLSQEVCKRHQAATL